ALSQRLREAVEEAESLRESLGAAEASSSEQLLAGTERRTQLETGLAKCRAELRSAEERGRRAERELDQAHAECQELLNGATSRDDRVEVAQALLEGRLRSLQDQLDASRADLEAARSNEEQLRQQAIEAEARCGDFRRSAAAWEEERQMASETDEGREKALEEELNRLRSADAADEARRTEAVASALTRASTAETK
ncbi:unnamed protein product, partial [Polarella glacialis]